MTERKPEGAMSKIAKKIDVFAKPPTLYYRGQSEITTVPGCVCTIVIGIIMFTLFVHDLSSFPSARTASHASFVLDEKYSFNPFTENDIKISFGV